jgi:ADP-heptose:LPS heptosyltransferase
MLKRGLLNSALDKGLKHWAGFAWWLLVLNHVDRFARRGAPAPHRPGEILVIRLEGIGDFVLFLDFARNLRRLFPPGRFRITLVGARLWTSLARGQSCFDEIWELDPGRFVSDLRYRYRLLRRVSRAGFSTAINATFSRDFLFTDPVIYASRAKTRVGFSGDLYKAIRLERLISSQWYTELVTGTNSWLMELLKGVALLRHLGFENCAADLPHLDLSESPPEGLPATFYVLCPSAGSALRRWPVEGLSRLAQRIFAKTGWTGVICGGPDDSYSASQILGSSRVPMMNYAGQLSLPALASTLARAQLVIGNETGTVHIAAAVGTPAVCILGGGHWSRFMPYDLATPTPSSAPTTVIHKMECFGCDWRCVHKPAPGTPAPCVANVSVEAVWAEIQAIIESCESAGAPIDRGARADNGEDKLLLDDPGD